ncbi:sulfotransferase family protein [Halospina denitrificans]|nr:sulfotransferase [Halospina denitrificans]
MEHPRGKALPFETRFTVDPDGVIHTLNSLTSCWTPFVGDLSVKRHIRLLRRVNRKSFLDRVAILAGRLATEIGISKNIRAYKEWELGKVFPNFEKNINLLEKRLENVRYLGSWAGGSDIRKKSLLKIPVSNSSTLASELFRWFLEENYRDLLCASGKDFLVEDNTFNSLQAKSLLDLLPGATLINVVRDPRDVIASYLQQRWTPSKTVDAVRYHKEIMNRWFEVRDTLDSNRYMELRLEDLSSDPGKYLKKVCEHAQVNFSEEMLRVNLAKSNTGRWYGDLHSSHHSWVESELGFILNEYNYT